MNRTLRSGFPQPPQRPPDKQSPDLSPKALSAWTKSLPVGFPEASAEKILDLVHGVNRLAIPEERKLGLFIGLGRQIRSILRTLHHKLLDVAAPPRRKEMELAELIILLHSEMALGFRNAVDWENDAKPGGKPLPLNRGTLLNRALHHLYRALQVNYLINVEPGNEIWEKIYALYALAREGGVLTEASDAFSGQVAATPEDAFKIILLAALSAPQSLRGSQLNRLWDLLPELAPCARLLRGPDDDIPESAFLVGLTSGQPPARHTLVERDLCEQASECLLFDVTPLLAEIRKSLTAQKLRKGPINPRRFARINTLKHLGSRMGARRTRSKRIPGDSEVEVIAGFRELHYFLSGGKRVAKPEAPKPKTPPKPAPRRPHPLINYNVILNLELVDIETQPSFTTAKEKKEEKSPPTFGTEKLDARRAGCRILNFSSGGYCLATDNTRAFNLKVGELIAASEGDKNRWLPGSVAWVTSDGHQLHFGVRLLAPFCRPGTVLLSGNGEESRPTECLLLLDDEQSPPSKMLMCPSCVQTGSILPVEYGDHKLELELNRVSAKTPGYIEYECSEVKPYGVEEDTVPLFDQDDPGNGPDEDDLGHPKPWKKL